MPNAAWTPGDAVRVINALDHADPPVAPGALGSYRGSEWTPHPHGFEIELLALVDVGGREVHCRFTDIEQIAPTD